MSRDTTGPDSIFSTNIKARTMYRIIPLLIWTSLGCKTNWLWQKFIPGFLPKYLPYLFCFGTTGLAWEGLVGSCKFAPVDDNLKIYWELSLVDDWVSSDGSSRSLLSFAGRTIHLVRRVCKCTGKPNQMDGVLKSARQWCWAAEDY